MTLQAHLPSVTYRVLFANGPEAHFEVTRFEAEEGINQCYTITLDVLTDELNLSASEMLGADCELTLQRGQHTPGLYCGLVSRVVYLGRRGQQLGLRVSVISAFELAQQTTRSRIWQATSVQDIVQEVLDGAFADAERKVDFGSVSRGSAPLDYCVQYRETDFAFVCRLLEAQGISWFFVHDAETAKEVLTLCDDNAQYLAFENTNGANTIPLVEHNPDECDVEVFDQFELTQCLTTTSVGRTDFDFVHPGDILSANDDNTDARGRVRRFYDHGQRRFIDDDLGLRVRDLAEAKVGAGIIASCTGNPIGARPGRWFTLEDLDVDFEDGQGVEEWLLTRAWHSSSAHGADLGYRARFECIPADVPLRPLPRTPKPRVYGPQTATVVGNGEIDVDELGRIEVQFHWEEGPSFAAGASCRVRCAQSWAGPSWGAQFIPRVGMEVVVEFLEGNPDRPLVTGCVYNGANSPPFALPGDCTQSGWRTNSSPGGGGANELRFEDAAGSEQIYIHAQKDKLIVIENDRTQSVGNDEQLAVDHDRGRSVGNNESLSIGVDRSMSVGSNLSEDIGANMTQSVGADQSISVGANRSISVSSNQSVQIGVASTELVMAAKTVTVGGVFATTVGAAMNTVVGAACAEEVGGIKSVLVGAMSTETVVGSKTVSAAAITQTAKADVAINAGANLRVESDANTQISAGGDLGIKGDKKGKFEFTTDLTITVGKAKIVLKKNGEVLIKGGKLTFEASKSVNLKGKKIHNN